MTDATIWSCWLTVCLMILSGSASGQNITFAELDGALIEALFIRQDVLRRNGPEFSARNETDFKLIIGPGDNIHSTRTVTSYTPKGRLESKPIIGLLTLERPREVQSLGGGHAVFAFEDGILTFLRTFKGGGFKSMFVFARAKEGLNCTASESFVREVGAGTIFLNSGVDGIPTIVVKSNQVSSSCRVAGGKPATAQ